MNLCKVSKGCPKSGATLGRLLVVDDESDFADACSRILSRHGYEAVDFTSPKAALEALREQEFDLLLTDLLMPEMDGITLLREALQIDPALVGIVMTGQATVQSAVDAMKQGALDYVLKPFEVRAMLPVLWRALEVRRLRLENIQLREAAAMHDLCQAIAFTVDPKLLLEQIAAAAHEQSGADEVSVMLASEDGQELRVAAVRGANRQGILGQRVAIDKGITGWVARHLESLTLNGPVTGKRFVPIEPRLDIRSAICMPMLASGKLIGTLNVNATGARRRSFSPGQVKALRILASTAAAALDNAQMIARLREKEERIRLQTTALEAAANGVVITDVKGNVNWVNAAFTRMTGYALEEIRGKNTRLLKSGKHDQSFYRELWQNILAGKVWSGEMINRRKDGSLYFEDQTITPVRAENGDISHFVAIKQDVSERKQMEDEFRRAQQRLQHVVTSSPAVLYTLAIEDLRPTWVGENVREMLGYSVEDVTQPNWWQQRVHPEDLQQTLAAIQDHLFTSNRLTHECRFRHAEGEYRWVRNEMRLLRDASGKPVEIVGSLSDITERKQLENQFRQAQKMEAVGRLAGGVAHDFNNLLTVITGYSDLAFASLSPGDPLREMLDQVRKAGERAAALTRQLLAFSRKQLFVPEVLDLNALFTDMKKMLPRLIGEDIDLEISLAPNLWPVKADTGQMEQVIMNLVVNARDAMPQGGKLTIETTNVELDETYQDTHPSSEPGPYVMLAVSDNGCGMDQATKARIFEPFFTTKAPDKGTGLGLATVWGIVKQSGGHIEVYSEVGIGTTFKIYLPRTGKGTEAEKKSQTGLSKPVRGTETVLLVEDEEGVRSLARLVLQSNGYMVLEAKNGAEALQMSQLHQGRIHLIATDVVMPNMSGRQLAERLEVLRPDMKVLYVSGYTDDAIVRHGILDARTPFLQKPFSPLAFARKVREVLDQ